MKRNKDGTLHKHSHAYQKTLVKPGWHGTKAEVDEYYGRILADAIGDLKYYRNDFASFYDLRKLDAALTALNAIVDEMKTCRPVAA